MPLGLHEGSVRLWVGRNVVLPWLVSETNGPNAVTSCLAERPAPVSGLDWSVGLREHRPRDTTAPPAR